MKQKIVMLFMAMLYAVVLTTAKAETVSVTLSREGTLAEKVLEQATSLSMVIDLTVSGPINESDWNSIALQMINLSTLNMKDATTNFFVLDKIGLNLESFVMPSGIKKIKLNTLYDQNGTYVGSSRYQLQYLELSNTVESIQGDIRNDKFATLKLGTSLKEIVGGFYYANNFSAIYADDISYILSINYYDEYSGLTHSYGRPQIFINDELLTDLNISNIPKINDFAFRDYIYLKKLSVSEGIIEIGDMAFAGCSGLEVVNLPSSLQAMGYSSFANCSLEKIEIPAAVTTIPQNCFSGNKSLKSVNLPEGVRHINTSAFSGCNSLQEIAFPETLQTIGSSAFSGCSGLTKVTSLIPFPINVTNGIFQGIDIEKCTLVVPEWSAVLYKMAMGWSDFAKIETVKTGDLVSMTVTDPRYLPATVRPNGTPNVSIFPSGSLTVRGELPFPMNEVTLGACIGEGKWNYGYDDNNNYYEYYSPSLSGAVLINDESSLSAQSARIKLESIGGTWGFISLPFDVKLSDITIDPEKEPSNFVFKYYDGERRGLVGTGGNWQEAANILKAGVGYIYQSQDSASIYLKATPETVNNICSKNNIKTVLQEYVSEDAEDAGWNFIGNPYPAYFDTHFIDFTAPITVWNGKGYDAVSLTDDDFVLSPYQAFFVQKQNDGNSITFFAEGRLAENRQTNSNKRISSRSVSISDNREIYNFYLSDDSYTDKCRIVINENSQIGYDASNDAIKFFSDNKSLPQIYSIGEKSVEYSINERPAASGIIELGVLTTNGLYTISSDSKQEIYLIDRMTNKTIDLSTSDYEFSADESDGNGRFAISLAKDMSSVNTVIYPAETRITVNGEILSIQCSEIETINVYSLDGVNITKLNGANNYSIKLSKGIYLVKTNNSVEKVIIR